MMTSGSVLQEATVLVQRPDFLFLQQKNEQQVPTLSLNKMYCALNSLE